jgi:hypothetical protein
MVRTTQNIFGADGSGAPVTSAVASAAEMSAVTTLVGPRAWRIMPATPLCKFSIHGFEWNDML